MVIEIVTAIGNWFYQTFGGGFFATLFAVGGSGWFVWRAKTTLDGVASGLKDLASSQVKQNEIMASQQGLCQRHASSQETLIDSMTCLVAEVHMASVSGNKVQEANMRAVLDLLERAMIRGDKREAVQHGLDSPA